MFLKRNNSSKLESLIGTQSSVEGNIEAKGTLRVDGAAAGHIKAEEVILGECGSIQGDVVARSVLIGGRIDGNVHAQESVEIKPKGKLFGDVFTRKLTVAEGGIFEGRSHVHRDEDASNVIDFPAREASSR
ncbi:MAG TPA: polymer-forming cytoskeletal protein [Dissulfurispiraceae bacterium]|nr:polymer-forming cytoskeletal protein [Dissulfurispiraceae bacterium]